MLFLVESNNDFCDFFRLVNSHKVTTLFKYDRLCIRNNCTKVLSTNWEVQLYDNIRFLNLFIFKIATILGLVYPTELMLDTEAVAIVDVPV
jgi:hypothetical protein